MTASRGSSAPAALFIAPQRLAQCSSGKHQVEAQAYADLAAGVGIDRVIQIGREDEQRAVFHPHHDLIGVSGSEFRDGWSDDAGLAARVVEVDAVAAGPGATAST